MGGLKKLFGGGQQKIDTTPIPATVNTTSQEADTTVDTQTNVRKKKGFNTTQSTPLTGLTTGGGSTILGENKQNA